ncbi:hypothetical protein PILCRDRAFT_12271 [Piloderma croceum F 1598]|uniref:Uncharacterized protein n=1 Tax=Piloderma croceum (strain F 1598) TaxID=765440 RepID=A0A0C3EX42_PILCF|nr:hypothetical protein PILCRDRAFT_12271 [Piloderma croceum F 1598]
MAAFCYQVLISIAKSNETATRKLDQFLAPMDGDMKSLASTALKHVHHAFYRKQPDWDCVIWNTHIMTVLSDFRDPIRHALLAQHSISFVTKMLLAITADAPSSATASLKAQAIQYGFWNLLLLIQSTDGVTWVIQALEAKLMFALIRCQPWLPHMTDDPAEFLNPFLNRILANYSAYRSVLCVIEKYLTKIQQSGLAAGISRDTPLWNAWNAFVEIVESRIEILRSAPGGILRAHERCHNAMARVMASFGNVPLVSLHNTVAGPARHTIGNSEVIGNFVRNLNVNATVEGHVPDISKGDFDFVGAMIEAERVLIQDGFSEIFKTVNRRLVVLILDYSVYPPTKTLIPPKNFGFCEQHYSEPLLARWDQLRKDMDTLAHPTLVFCARVQRGHTSMSIFRVVSTTLTDEPDELIIFKSAGCTC